MTRPKTKAAQRTLVTFLLDRTGSMSSILDDTIGAFNTYVDTLKIDGDMVDFTLIQFDSQSLDRVCVATPIAKAPRLNKTNYVPRASTPLIDAAYKTIKAVEKQIAGIEPGPKVIVCIQTDGHENASVDHDMAALNALIKEKTDAGWQFNFMGASIDAYDTAARMGVALAATMSYDPSSAATTDAAFVASARNTQAFARGLASHTHYTMQQRRMSGDSHAHNYLPPDPAAQAQPSAPPPATPKPKPIVDDFTL